MNIYLSIYLSIFLCRYLYLSIYLYLYLSIYIYLGRASCPSPTRIRRSTGHNWGSPRVLWPLQDIRLLQRFCARSNHPILAPPHLHCPHECNTIAQLLRNIRPPSNPPCVCRTPYKIANSNIM